MAVRVAYMAHTLSVSPTPSGTCTAPYIIYATAAMDSPRVSVTLMMALIYKHQFFNIAQCVAEIRSKLTNLKNSFQANKKLYK